MLTLSRLRLDDGLSWLPFLPKRGATRGVWGVEMARPVRPNVLIHQSPAATGSAPGGSSAPLAATPHLSTRPPH